MNTTKIMVRLDAEHHAAELEVMTPHESASSDHLDYALRRIGLRPLGTIELSTPRYRVTRTKITELDGMAFSATRVMQILRAARASATAKEPFLRAA